MKTILKLILSGIILFGAVPTVNATPDMKMDNMEEVKKKKKKKRKSVVQKVRKRKRIFLESIWLKVNSFKIKEL